MAESPPRWARAFGASLLTASLLLPLTQSTAAAAIPPGDYQQVQLASGAAKLGEPMSLTVLPDRSVVHTARDGTVRVTNAAGNTTTVAGKLDVYTHDEEGLQGVAADPAFATNRWLYLYYSPRLSTPDGDAPTEGTEATFAPWRGELHLSRFTLKTDNTLDLASEKIVLRVPNDRGQCCHVGGDLDFDAQGNLYLTTGDDTNPFVSDGYTPTDQRADRNPQFDAQRSSGNTNDLRGKVLRIKPQADGTYTVPAGNLFAPGTARTRPEIYAMGFRNPFRMSVDKATGIVYLGDYGPDAGVTSPTRGPSGQVEFNRITRPGNFGWPYCTGTNTTDETYVRYTFPSGPSGARYECGTGVNNTSPRNTGLATLPAAQPAWIRYAGDAGSPPEFGGGSESPMGGPVYRYDPALDSATKFPQSLDGRYFAGEYGRQWIKAIGVGADGSPGPIEAFPWSGTQVMDMQFGPDGSLYVLDYGTGGGNQAIYRIDYKGNAPREPVARAAADRTSGPVPLTVRFSSAGSTDPEGGALSYRWTFGDGGTSTEANPMHTYTAAGNYSPTLTVTDPQGLTGTASVLVTAGNTAPTVTLRAPGDGALFAFGDTVPFQVSVSDPEDGAIDCSRVKVTYLLGHDSHRHQITQATGCGGQITVPVDGEHDAAANIYGVFDAEYTDRAGLTSHAVSVLQPRHRQAEHHTAQQGVEPANHGGAEGGRTIGFTDNGDWISFQPYRLGNARSVTARVSSGGPGGTIEVRAGSATGTLLGTLTVPNTGGWDTFADVSADLANAPTGTTALFFVFKGVTGQGNLLDLDAFTFTTGAVGPPGPEVLVFSKTAGFRHDAIPAGTQAIRDLGSANGFTVTATEDAAAFTTANLARYAVVVFLNTTGDVLDAAQQTAFQSYVDGGGGYVGVHAAADTEYDWPYYGQLVGAYFHSHPHIQQATVRPEDRSHPATAHLPATWSRTDEWYNFRTNPRATSKVLANVDESGYTGGTMAGDHPISWCRTQASGRSFYTGLGHTVESYADPVFRNHLLGGIRYAAGLVQADCRPQGQPSQRVEGEAYTSSAGVQIASHGTAGGGQTVGYIDDGDWAGYGQTTASGKTRFTARVSSGNAGGRIEIRAGSQTGTLLGSVAVTGTGGFDRFAEVSTTLAGPASGPVFLVFTGTGAGGLFDVDHFTLS
ncbi:ThuA domain-containing protein [Saccharothrix sp. 6-C]|uniref:ThuA domain-containing protein n=1 Tax=Saccharothrix sp. 6-C TaxID=2781735 RepID=UPI0019174C75|nr:ThuA domain-containing protein [Saccharothrix sp. 6-C]QQQ79463.1 ThuA domain-containing protein [Saccharothrix sp. 6-C]